MDAEFILKCIEDGNVTECMERTEDDAILQDYGDTYKHYVNTEEEKLALELALIYEGKDSEWFAFLITTPEHDRTTRTFIGVTKSPYREAARHSLGMVARCKTTRRATWTLRLFVGPFETEKEAQEFSATWKHGNRMDNRFVRGPALAKEWKKDFFFGSVNDSQKYAEMSKPAEK